MNAPDMEVMAWAHENHHIVFTHDMDFGALPASTRASGPSVLQVRVKNTMPDAIGHDVIRVLNLRRDLFEQGVLVTLDKIRSRMRVLPLAPVDDTPTGD